MILINKKKITSKSKDDIDKHTPPKNWAHSYQKIKYLIFHKSFHYYCYIIKHKKARSYIIIKTII